jgi:hypothetical protein
MRGVRVWLAARTNAGTERRHQVAVREIDVRAHRRRGSGHDAGAGSGQRRVGGRQVLGRIPQHTGTLGQLGVREEAGLALAHAQAQLIGGPAVVVEEEQPDVAVPRVRVDVNLVAQRVADAGQPAVEGELAAQQAVHAFAAILQVDAQPADEEQVGLPRLDQDAGGHAAVVEVPGVGRMSVSVHTVPVFMLAGSPTMPARGRPAGAAPSASAPGGGWRPA